MAAAPGPRSFHAALDRLRLHYLEWGAPDGPTLVLLHALGALVTAHDWDDFAAAVQGTHRVIAPDQRGFGLSDWTPRYSFQLMAEDLAQLVERLELDSFSLIGHSMGGTVACLYAEEHPNRLRRLVLEDTVPPRDGGRIERPGDVQWEFAGFDELLAVARQHGLQGGDDELRARFAPAIRWLDGGRVGFRLDPAVRPALLAQLADPDPAWWRDLARIGVPTLIVRGADSQVLDAEQLTLAAAAISDCRVVEVPHAGHSVHFDNPTGFLEAVCGFLD
jgi:pimeloyl-ACP methyl ester carboxylesterase